MWLFVLNQLKKDTRTETWSIYDDILDIRVPIVVVVDCWPFTREISDNRKRKCLQIPDYYRKFSYDTHTTIV